MSYFVVFNNNNQHHEAVTRSTFHPMGKKKKKSSATSGGSYTIVTDPLKGRCLHTTVDLAPGSVVFEEESLVAAKWDPASCDLCGNDHTLQECDLQKSMVPSEAVHLLGGLVEAMVIPLPLSY